MKKIKQILIKFEDNSVKGYNLSGFLTSFQNHLQEWMKQKGIQSR